MARRPSRITVLINNYENGRWLRDCIDSVLNQSLPPDEVIVYDDGSRDESLDILRSYGQRIHLIEGVHDYTRNGPMSQANAVVKAFEVSTGDHIYLLDGDDVFLPDKIASYEKAWAGRTDAILVQAPMLMIDAEGDVLTDTYVASKHRLDYLRATYRMQDADFYYAMSSLAFHRGYLDRRLPLDYTCHQDAATDVRLTSVVPLFGKVVTLDACHTLWRQRTASMSQNRLQRDPLANTLRRHRCFNQAAREYGFRPIHLWRNRRFYLQVARRLLPEWMSAPFVHNPEGRPLLHQ